VPVCGGHVDVSVCVRVFAFVWLCVDACVRLRACVCMRVRVRACVCVCVLTGQVWRDDGLPGEPARRREALELLDDVVFDLLRAT